MHICSGTAAAHLLQALGHKTWNLGTACTKLRRERSLEPSVHLALAKRIVA